LFRVWGEDGEEGMVAREEGQEQLDKYLRFEEVSFDKEEEYWR